MADSNPIAASVYMLAVAGIAMFSTDPLIGFLCLLGGVLYYLSRNGRKHGKTHGFSLCLFTVMALINPLVSHNGATVLFVMNNNPVTLEALLYGMSASMMIVAVLYWFRSFSQIMSGDKLLYMFGALSPKLALVLSMSLRYVPLFSDQAKKVNRAQKALGLYKEDNIADTFKGGLRVFSVMITWALENGIITADSMAARGYGIGKRSHFSLFRFRRRDVLLLIAGGVLFALTVAGIGGREFVYYPNLWVPPITVRGMVGYLSYGIMILLPTLLEGKEALKWRYLKSRI